MRAQRLSSPRQPPVELLRSSHQAHWDRRLFHRSAPGQLRLMGTSSRLNLSDPTADMAIRRRLLDTACLSHVCCLETWKKQGAAPRDSTGLASVREKRRSRHACQALLLWLYGPSVRYAYRLASIPGLPRVSLPSSLRYSPTATYDYGNCLHLAGGPSASAVHRLSQGFAGFEAWNSLGRHTQKLLKPRSSTFSPRTRGRVIDEKRVSMVTSICPFGNRSAATPA
jgi:hypothetical protein